MYDSVEQAVAAAKLYRHDRTARVSRHPPTASDLHVGFKNVTTSAEFLEEFKLWEKRDVPVPNECNVCGKLAYPAEDGPEAEEAKASMCAWPHAEPRHYSKLRRRGYVFTCRNRVCLECAQKPHPQQDGADDSADVLRGRYCHEHCTPSNHEFPNGVGGVRAFISPDTHAVGA